MAEKETDFRDYNNVNDSVREHYKEMRQNQSLTYVIKMKYKWQPTVGERGLTIKEAFNKLSNFVDRSDPDTTLSNVQHMFQTAEKIRSDNMPDWLQLTGLIHDLGKIMILWGKEEDGQSLNKQWGVCGDTWMLGIPEYKQTVFPEFQGEQTKLEYNEECGLDNMICSWGHDEYLYQILKNQCELPEIALKIIRYHSLYPWHRDNAYLNYCSNDDFKVLKWVNIFNKYDLYTKTDETLNINELWPYYEKLIDKYIPGIIYF